MPTEADTCRTPITPKLQVAGWEDDPHSIAEQRAFTDGRIIVRANKAERRKGKRADYILRYTRDLPIAVVEAKAEGEEAANGCNLDRKNPRAKEDITHLPPEQLAADILNKEQRIAEIMGNIRNLLAKHCK
jgi:type I site-specific restriction endonuclease